MQLLFIPSLFGVAQCPKFLGVEEEMKVPTCGIYSYPKYKCLYALKIINVSMAY
jgi:hypothetical protein